MQQHVPPSRSDRAIPIRMATTVRTLSMCPLQRRVG